MIKQRLGKTRKNGNTDISIEDIPTIEPEGLHMEKHLYHELIQRKLCMKDNTQNIFVKQPECSAIIDCNNPIEYKPPNVQRIVNLLRQILDPPAAELFKMHIHLISSSFKAKNACFRSNFQTG